MGALGSRAVGGSQFGDLSKGAQLASDQVVADWRILDEYAMMLHDQDSKNAKERKFANQRKLYDELSRQVEAKNMVEKRMRDEQLIVEKNIREEEEAVKKVEEEKMVLKIQKEIRQEEDKKIKKIEAQKAHMAKVFEENRINRAKKEDEAQRIQAEDIKTMKEYNRAMEKQEKKREQEKEARLERQKQLLERMKETVQAQAQAKGQEDEIRAAKQKEEADARALANSLEKQMKLQVLRCETRDFQLCQIQNRNEKKQNVLELKKLQAGVLEEDTANYDAAEKKKVEAAKLKQYKHQAELQEQIKEKERRIMKVEMSDVEKQMNLPLLKHVYEALGKNKKAVTDS